MSPFVAASQARSATRAAGGALSSGEQGVVELLAEYAIEGAKTDSAIINPAMAIANIVDEASAYVNEWKEALRPEDSETTSGTGGEDLLASVGSTLQGAAAQVTSHLEHVTADSILQGVSSISTQAASRASFFKSMLEDTLKGSGTTGAATPAPAPVPVVEATVAAHEEESAPEGKS